MSEQKDIQQLLREGIEAARANDKETARQKFEEVVERDENNEKAWFWMASVVETEEEKRVCLGNVLFINPDNEKARQFMARLDSRKRAEEGAKEVIPGVSRRQFTTILAVGIVTVLAIVILFGAIIISNNSRQTAESAALTEIAGAQTATTSAQAAAVQAATETTVALYGTDTPTPRPDLPPTWTPEPELTPATAVPGLPFPPARVQGSLAAWGGRDLQSVGALPLLLFQVNAEGASTRIGDQAGRDVRFAGSGQRVVYSRYLTTTFSFSLEAVNTNGTQPQLVQFNAPVIETDQPDHCRVANRVAFIAAPAEGPSGSGDFQLTEPPPQVYIHDFDNNKTVRLTNDTVSYSSPAFSPDCSLLAVVRNDVNSASPGPDIIIVTLTDINWSVLSQRPPQEGETLTPEPFSVIGIEARIVNQLTADLGASLETTPRWTADGLQIVYAAAPGNAPDNSDIFMVNAVGSSTPLALVRAESDDRNPVISPDGQFLAFASNRAAAGAYNIFVTDLNDQTVWQLTNSEDNHFPGDWWLP